MSLLIIPLPQPLANIHAPRFLGSVVCKAAAKENLLIWNSLLYYLLEEEWIYCTDLDFWALLSARLQQWRIIWPEFLCSAAYKATASENLLTLISGLCCLQGCSKGEHTDLAFWALLSARLQQGGNLYSTNLDFCALLFLRLQQGWIYWPGFLGPAVWKAPVPGGGGGGGGGRDVGQAHLAKPCAQAAQLYRLYKRKQLYLQLTGRIKFMSPWGTLPTT
jgi:hypothetical protein